MIDAFKDKLLTMTEAAKLCPKVRGKRPTPVTMWRWATKGQRGVKLEHIRVGRCMCTTEAALNEFFCKSATNLAVEQPCTPKRKQSSTDRQREQEIARAVKNLEARGILPKASGQ